MIDHTTKEPSRRKEYKNSHFIFVQSLSLIYGLQHWLTLNTEGEIQKPGKHETPFPAVSALVYHCNFDQLKNLAILREGLSSPNAWFHDIIYNSVFVTLNLRTSFLGAFTEQVHCHLLLFLSILASGIRMSELMENSIPSKHTSLGSLWEKKKCLNQKTKTIRKTN